MLCPTVVSSKSLVSSLEEGRRNPSMDISADVPLDAFPSRDEELRELCSQCHQRMIRAKIGMTIFI